MFKATCDITHEPVSQFSQSLQLLSQTGSSGSRTKSMGQWFLWFKDLNSW